MLYSNLISPLVATLVFSQCISAVPVDNRHIRSRGLSSPGGYELIGRAPDPAFNWNSTSIRNHLSTIKGHVHRLTTPSSEEVAPSTTGTGLRHTMKRHWTKVKGHIHSATAPSTSHQAGPEPNTLSQLPFYPHHDGYGWFSLLPLLLY